MRISMKVLSALVLVSAGLVHAESVANADSGIYPAQVSVGTHHTCVLMTDGSVRCWGQNASSQSDVPSSLGQATSIQAGFAHSCAMVNSDLSCWGQWKSSDGDYAPKDLTNVAALSASDGDTCALTTDGRPHCWGSNYMGQLDLPLNLPKLRLLSTGMARVCGIADDNRIFCWGNTRYFNVSGGTIPGSTKIGLGSYLCYLGRTNDPNYFNCMGDDPFW
ncbi:MAG: hypothetical protein WCJ22_00705, partial [Actinomycetes bacterium]